MKKRLLLIVMVLAGVSASVAAYYRTTAAAASPEFVTIAVSRGDIVETVEATGTLEAVTTVQVGSQVSGTIQSLHADFNSQVKKGQVIARLDPSVLQAQVEQAEASVLRLQADVERARIDVADTQNKLRRARELMEKGLIPATELETAETTALQAQAALKASQAQVAQAMASLNQNRVNLSHTVITAPVDGIVISRSVDVGQTVAASMSAPELFKIAKDLTRMQVNASIDEADIGRIRSGQTVAFSVDAYPNQRFTGTVSQVRLNPVVAQNVVSYVTIIDVPNRDLKLKPGMTATVTVEVARADDVIRVPNAALRFRPAAAGDAQAPAQARSAGAEGRARGRDAGARVWTLQEGQPRPVRVETGISDGTTTAVTGGDLADGTQVITGMAPAAAGAAATTSPLLPFGGRRPGAGSTGGNRSTGAARPAGATR